MEKYKELIINNIDNNITFEDYILVSFVANEELYVKEWLDHHLNIGFDKIILFNNDNNQDILKNTINNSFCKEDLEKIIIINFSGYKDFQLNLQNAVLYYIPFKWCMILDGDEFLKLNFWNNIKEYIDFFENNVEKIYGKNNYQKIKPLCINFNWLSYGSNNQEFYIDLPVQYRFKKPTIPVTNNNNKLIKNIINKDILTIYPKIKYINIKSLEKMNANIYNSDFSTSVYNNVNKYQYQNICYKYAYVAHYSIKSLEEFNNRKKNRIDINDIYTDEYKSYLLNIYNNDIISEELQEIIDKINNAVKITFKNIDIDISLLNIIVNNHYNENYIVIDNISNIYSAIKYYDIIIFKGKIGNKLYNKLLSGSMYFGKFIYIIDF